MNFYELRREIPSGSKMFSAFTSEPWTKSRIPLDIILHQNSIFVKIWDNSESLQFMDHPDTFMCDLMFQWPSHNFSDAEGELKMDEDHYNPL